MVFFWEYYINIKLLSNFFSDYLFFKTRTKCAWTYNEFIAFSVSTRELFSIKSPYKVYVYNVSIFNSSVFNRNNSWILITFSVYYSTYIFISNFMFMYFSFKIWIISKLYFRFYIYFKLKLYRTSLFKFIYIGFRLCHWFKFKFFYSFFVCIW